jgi:hypothetical protein
MTKYTVSEVRQRILKRPLPDGRGSLQGTARASKLRAAVRFVTGLVAVACFSVYAETNLERGKRVVNEAFQAVGGERYLAMKDRVEEGRAYSFYREQLSGLSIAKIIVRYLSLVQDTGNTLAVEEREYFGKNQDYSILFGQDGAYEISFRGARPIPADRWERYKETTLRDIFYILRIRLKEPGMIFESRSADVLDNRPVEIVDITDNQNRTTTVYFDQTTKLPVRQVFYRRDPQTRERNEEITDFSKYRDLGGGVQWPFAIHRERNGEKIFEMFSESGQMNKGFADNLFRIPSGSKILKPQ